MSNMSYCRMQNTLSDLRECVALYEEINSIDERRAWDEIVRLAHQIAEDHQSLPDIDYDDESDDPSE